MTEKTFSNWLLGDHLGSTSMVADASGTAVSELRYSAFGEIRYQNGTLTTDYLYTGQRQEAEIGLYYYVARWYDPAIGRFIQADSIVPDPASGLGYDRYAYSANNPLKYIDPSGHYMEQACGYGGGDCGSSDLDFQGYYSYLIENKYQWTLNGNWTLEELKTVYQTANDIESYVDDITYGKGRDWMNEYMGGISIEITQKERGSGTPGKIKLPYWWSSSSKNKQYFSHELAHIWDINTGRLGLIGAVKGPADHLNRFIHDLSTSDFPYDPIIGSPGCRFCDNSGNKWIPPEFRFPEGHYGNNSTADYLAESFGWMIYDPNQVPVEAAIWLEVYISIQANKLP